MAGEVKGNIRQIDIIDKDHSVGQTFTIGYPSYYEVDYLKLVGYRDTGTLEPGAWYRITNYQTTVGIGGSSAYNDFDLLVQATSVNTISEFARAINKNPEGYFKGSKLDAWEIKYCIDNDTDRFEWAVSKSNNGRGVIYYMKDENGNECGYDFKNIQMGGRFTFDNNGADMSLTSKCRNNKIAPNYENNGQQSLNQITFKSNDATNANLYVYGNVFGPNCHHIVMGAGCVNNHFMGGNSYIAFGTSNSNNVATKSKFEPTDITTQNYYSNNSFAQGVSCLYLYPKGSTPTTASNIKNVVINAGVHGGKTISLGDYNISASDPMLLIDIDGLGYDYTLNFTMDKNRVLTRWTS